MSLKEKVRKKKQLPFLRLLDNPLSKYLTFYLNNFLNAMAVLGYLPKL